MIRGKKEKDGFSLLRVDFYAMLFLLFDWWPFVQLDFAFLLGGFSFIQFYFLFIFIFVVRMILNLRTAVTQRTKTCGDTRGKRIMIFGSGK
ncbi:hypothetical protein [Alkalihalobacillus pseudalcaliphilus]|uniref:hypothetical protein n=1 Tax=Alkalihalobacillus pseudalcaliphilus TaxID=79884 RepID=UPI00064D752A|nr:hypothetical protein [Alkalihalobacillus pseudalcaliphilus]KMK78014.1 hypothetical protein AB990_00745 [Alkalihalobacillus pseudalcaliphilus]